MSTLTLALAHLSALALLPSPLRPRALAPLPDLCLCHPCPLLPPSTTTTLAAVDDHHQFFRTVDDNDHQNPLDVIFHLGR